MWIAAAAIGERPGGSRGCRSFLPTDLYCRCMRRAVVTIVVGSLLTNTLSASAAETTDSLRSPAASIARAEPLWAAPEVVTIINRGGELLPDVASSAITAAQASYGTWALSRGANVSM